MKKLSRRTLLRGAGGAALALPFLEAMLGPRRSVAQTGAVPKRVIFWFTSCGPVPETWWPTGGETDFALPMAMQPLEPFRDRILIPDGVQMTTAIERSGGRNGHDVGTGHAMVCRPLQEGPSGFGEFGHLWDGSAGGISIDQHIADAVGEDTRFKSLEYGVRAQGIRQAVPSRISYRAAFEPVIPMHGPAAAFDRVFGPLTGDAAAQARQARRRELVLGAVQGELGRLRPRLGSDDRRRVDAHVAALDDITSRLDGFDGAVCNVPERGDTTNVPEWGRLHLDMMARAMACDLTRVASIQWANGQSGMRHEWLGQSDAHHSLSHRGDSDTDARNQVSAIDRWYMEQFAYLLGALDSVEAGDGQTLLDHTTVVWVNEQTKGIGNVHRFTRMPYVIAGGGGGYWRTGRKVDVEGRSHSDMFVNVMHAMGMSDTSFGDPDFCTGPIDALSA
ncbi:MAG: DUF1552 domain-containing protein [Deltaproteobacteria bacterium]|nr:DUF1552 domain-containing protein [Deltaproteobacteria bacterium]